MKDLQAHKAQDSQTQDVVGGGVRDGRLHETQAIPKLDHDEVIKRAKDHVGHSGDSSIFAAAMHHLSGHHPGEHTRPINTEHVTNCHREAYENKNSRSMDAAGIGNAAAMQALKLFTAGGSGEGDGSSKLVALAMSEASKLFDSGGGAKSGTKQDAVTSAAMTIMKIVVQSKVGGGGLIGGDTKGALFTLVKLTAILL